MSKFNPVKIKTPFASGIITGVVTDTAGKYKSLDLLRRVTLSNMLWESNYYQEADEIQNQIENLVRICNPEDIVNLAIECRFEQKLRHTPLWLLLLVAEIHKGYPVKNAIAKVCTRPDMCMDLLGMLKVRRGTIKPISKGIKNGIKLAFDNFDNYQIAKYKRTNSDIKLIDVVNLVHPKPTEKNKEALADLVKGSLGGADTWETALSSGADKKESFVDLISRGKMGSIAILRNLSKFLKNDLDRDTIRKAISQVNSPWLTPLDFLKARKYAPAYSSDINNAMKKSFLKEGDKLMGTTIVAIDVSGSMGSLLMSELSTFSRLDLAFAMAALASYICEDLILVFTAGNDSAGVGKHTVWANDKGLSILDDYNPIYNIVGGGGIFTYQLCEWLKTEGHAKNADRLIVFSDSQDCEHNRFSKIPDTKPYKSSYIVDISTNTHGIKTSNWTLEVNGWTDKIFHYIREVEKNKKLV